MARPAQRYLRFVQALALGSTALAGCYDNHRDVETTDAGAGTDAPVIADAGVVGTDAPRCSSCTCSWELDTGPIPSCDSIGEWECCAAVGPCAPPDLPVA